MKTKLAIASFVVCALLVCLFQINFPRSKIISTESLKPIEMVLKDVNEETLVIFDVDDVLVTQSDQIFLAEKRQYFKKILNEYQKRFSKEQVEEWIHVIMAESPVQIVDPNIIPIIKSLQAKKVPVMALTALSTASFKNKFSFVDWRIQELETIGITFKDYWAHIQPKQLPNFKIKYAPAFKAGILFSSGKPKGEVLQAFLQDINFIPKKIIFIDDNRDNLVTVEKFCKKLDIQYLGFEYTAVLNFSPENFNQKRAQLQIQVLENEQRWLSDAQADQMIR